MGVVHGIRSFVPRMIAQGGEGVVVNSSSILGLYGGYTNAVYPVSKHGVVVLSESLYNEFKRRRLPISVHVLCPSFVNTEILDSGRTRPRELASSAQVPDTDQAQAYIDWFRRMHRQGKNPDEVAQILLRAIRAGTFYVLTHPEMNKMIEHRLRAIVEGGDPTGMDTVRESAAESVHRAAAEVLRRIVSNRSEAADRQPKPASPRLSAPRRHRKSHRPARRRSCRPC